VSDPRLIADTLSRLPFGGVTNVRIGRDGAVSCAVEPASLVQLARTLYSVAGGELILLTADDRRADLGAFLVHYLFANHGTGWVVHVTVNAGTEDPEVPSLATVSYPASRFEREMRDLFGIRPDGHPDPEPLVRHGFWPVDYHPLRKDARPPAFEDDGRPFPFRAVEGDGVYEIPVGPVHAGIIEPGHFRFSAVGETIIDVKQRLFFTHKGTEKLFEGRTPEAGVVLAERVSGDTTAGHALAFCRAVETAAGIIVPPRAAHVRATLVELERIYNHVADFGMIVSDTGFALAHAHAYRIRERLFRLNQRLTGSRLLRGAIVIGGVSRDAGERVLASAPHRDDADAGFLGPLDEAVRAFLDLVDICLENSLVTERLERTGILDERTARDHGVRGYVARASGIDADARRDHPHAPYDRFPVQVPVLKGGDVHARAMIRVAEVKESARVIRQLVEQMPDGDLAAPARPMPPFEPAFALVEGWRGTIVHWVSADAEHRLHRVKIVDPSFLNWPALSRALVDNIVPDFPLCNKSFNQSYSGNDL
jgi:Ni,Fe-hydrogenase III large subunit/Ni,Fe-hydrogenase III component G